MEIIFLGIACAIFWLIICMCMKDKQKETTQNEKEIRAEKKESENNAEHVSAKATDAINIVDPRQEFQNAFRYYFIQEEGVNYYATYLELQDLIRKMSKTTIDEDVVEIYAIIANQFRKFCRVCETYHPLNLFEYNEYGKINNGNLKFLEGLHEGLLLSILASAERALTAGKINRILKIDVGYLYHALLYFSFINIQEDKYLRVRKVVNMLCKQTKIEVLICDIYMEHIKGNGGQIREYIYQLMKKDYLQKNGITNKMVFEVASALSWMGECIEEELLVSNCYGEVLKK